MLAYILAFVVGLGSFALYMAAFFFPEVHRKNDFIWSGVGLFYALVLWVCAERITGGVLLGQTASVVLLGWLGWQTLTLRRQVAPIDQQTAVPTPEELKETLSDLAKPENLSKVSGQVGTQLGKLQSWAQTAVTKSGQGKAAQSAPKSAEEPYVPLTPEDFGPTGRQRQATVPADSSLDSSVSSSIDAIAETITDIEPEIDDAIDPAAVAPPSVPPVAPPTSTPKSTVPKSTAPPTAKPRSSAKPPDEEASGIFGQVQSLFKGIGKKPQPKTVYVRKQYRTAEPEDTAVEDTPLTEAAPEAAIAPPPAAQMPTDTTDVVSGGVSAADERSTQEMLEENEAAILSATFVVVDGIVEDSPLPADAVVQSEIAYEAAKPVSFEADENAELSATPEAIGTPEASENTAAVPVSESDSPVEPESLQAIPPHPPSPELVEAAIADAEEKQVPADPPATTEENPDF